MNQTDLSVPAAPFDDYRDTLYKFDSENRRRHIPSDRSGALSIDLVSNDYLGLGHRWHEFMPEFMRRFPDASFSSSASRLLGRRQRHHLMLEEMLGELYTKKALLFNSGYHANVGLIQALASDDTVFLCDKLVHASIIDGLMLAKADYYRWKHNDIESLSVLLEKNRNRKRCIVVLESVYSMDGDIAPLGQITELKKLFPSMLIYLDEAHALGTFGPKGLGVAEEAGLTEKIDFIIGTLGKAVASCGAFVATTPVMADYFINCSRSFIFSTAIPPVNAAWSYLMIEKILTMKEERENLHNLSYMFRKGIEDLTGAPNSSMSQIVPLHTGDARKAVATAGRLALMGIDALPIRRPTVPPGGERIRFSLNAGMLPGEVDTILEKIKESLNEN